MIMIAGKSSTGNCSRKALKNVQLENLADGRISVDVLHTKLPIPETPCTENRCMGSIVFPPRTDGLRSKEETIVQATDFIRQYYTHIKRVDTPSHKKRLQEVLSSIEETGTYNLAKTELIFGAKTAWRNAPRCIGRIQWSKLQVFDCRDVRTAPQMFAAICDHLKYATNKGNLRSAITIFPQRTEAGKDFRVWNQGLLSYAGYTMEDGSIVGDPGNAQFTKVCQKLGWKGNGGPHDILPLVLQAEGGIAEVFDIPPHLILEVDIEHPKFEWFKDFAFKWYAVPAVSSIMLDVGGLQFTGAPFNGWYMGTEIGSRDMCDTYRYNMAEKIAKKMGLDTSSNANLWKDQALVQCNVAVMHSYQKNNVTISDHHTASETFMKHMENEQRLRGGCPADWVWVVPPLSGSITQVFHQEMLNYQLKPSYEYQDPGWKHYQWNKENGDIPATEKGVAFFKKAVLAVKFASGLIGKAMAKRIPATILYGTETGKSETYAKALASIFNHAFHAKVMSMADYDVAHVESETLLLIVTSTFGNGEPPGNAQSFFQYLMELNSGPDNNETGVGNQYEKFTSSKCTSKGPLPLTRRVSELNHTEPLANVRFSVFGLGSKAYPRFAEFGRAVDTLLEELGGERILSIGEGDELSGQESSFKQWAKVVFETACNVFCLEDGVDMTEAGESLTHGTHGWADGQYRVVIQSDKPKAGLCEELSKIHNKTILPALVKKKQHLLKATSERSTILVELDTQGDELLLYEPGDHVAIFPENERELVDRVLERIDTDIPAGSPIQCEYLEETHTPFGDSKVWVASNHLPPCSLRHALAHYLDITTPPTQHFLHKMSEQATDTKEKDTLIELSTVLHSYEEWKHDFSPNVPEVLEQFPSVSIKPSFLLIELPILKARYYSISSSLKMHPGALHVTVAVVSYHVEKANGIVHDGVCSNFLDRVEKGQQVPCFIRKAPMFHMPEDNQRPIIMVGPGTGIAPFRSFWQERQIDIQQSKVLGNMILVFGCRRSDEDNLYRHESKKAQNDGALTKVLIALSREPDVPKTYVQDMLRNNASEVFEQIDQLKGHIYVCGDVQMAADVSDALVTIVAQEGKMTRGEAQAYITNMRNNNMYHEDIFGVTLRTKEVKIKLHKRSRVTLRVSELAKAYEAKLMQITNDRNSSMSSVSENNFDQ